MIPIPGEQNCFYFFLKAVFLPVHLTEYVEDERLHIKVEGLVVEEQFGEKAEVLAIQLVVLPIHLEKSSYYGC